MRTSIVVLLLLVLTSGCGLLGHPDPALELLQSDLRWMEDNLYALDDELRRCHEQLESAKRNNAALREELKQARSQAPRSDAPPSDASQNFDQPSDADLYDFSTPKIEIGDPLPSEGEPQVQPPVVDPGPGDAGDGNAGEPVEGGSAQRNAARPERIVLNRRLTGGFDEDRAPGHEGVLVVIEPQDASGATLPLPGELTVEVQDPQQRGLAGRVGKWHFDSIDSAKYLKQTTFGNGFHLRLPWPHEPPASDQLTVRVSYETVDGRVLQAAHGIKIRPPNARAAHLAQGPRRPTWSPQR